ncbi:conserved hypothetical protein [Beggiatoa sp. PS]|nr:conserved hypothetical protein [Beggiatoa sp. PS]
MQTPGSWILSVAFNPDGKIIAFDTDESAIMLWDIFTNQSINKLYGHTNWIESVVSAMMVKCLRVVVMTRQ